MKMEKIGMLWHLVMVVTEKHDPDFFARDNTGSKVDIRESGATLDFRDDFIWGIKLYISFNDWHARRYAIIVMKLNVGCSYL